MRGKELLTVEQRNELLQIPFEPEHELAIHYTLSEDDLKTINQLRREHNRLGFTIQLCLLRYPGCSITNMIEIPERMLQFVAKQIGVDHTTYYNYARRDPTRREHLEKIRKEYGYKNFSLSSYRRISKFLQPHALENGNTTYLIQTVLQELRKEKIILPAIPTIERLVWETRKRSEEKIFKTLTSSLTSPQLEKLNHLLHPMPNTSKTYLAWLREIPGQFSPDAFLKVVERLEYIRRLGLQLDMKYIHPNRLRQLSRIGSRYEPFSFRRFQNNKRYAILIAYLMDLTQELVDLAFEIHDKQIMNLQLKGRKQQEEIQKQNGKAVNEKINHYANLGDALIKAKQENLDPFSLLETIMPWEKFLASVEEAKKLSRPMNYDYLDLLESRYNYLRKYTPTLLRSLEFKGTKYATPVLLALDTIHQLNESGKRKISEDAPLAFVSKRWKKHVFNEDGTINRHFYEIAAFTELRNYIRSGDISIIGSRQHKEFDEYLVSEQEWREKKENGIRLTVPIQVQEYMTGRTEALLNRIQSFSENAHSLEGVDLEKGSFQVHRLEKDVPEEAKKLSSTLYNMLPRIKLTDLLLEVSNWTKFEQQLIHASTNKPPKGDEITVSLASLMAMGTNIGLTKMADSTPDISYHQLAHAGNGECMMMLYNVLNQYL